MPPNRITASMIGWDELPLANVHGKPQESYLLPSQPPDSQVQACRLFFKDGDPAAAENSTEPTATAPAPNGSQPGPATPGAPHQPGRGPPSPPTTRAITVEHHVFMRTPAGQLALANPTAPIASTTKIWERVIPKGEAVLKTVLHHAVWPVFKTNYIAAIDATIPLLACKEEDLLKWQGIILRDKAYGKAINAMITSPEDFRAFVDACHANLLRKVLVKVLMADLAKVAKALEVVSLMVHPFLLPTTGSSQ
ncbi:hypothetical protein PTTG_04500 [Puccinia triticina 1-1 BBBD Race 1]|uniref:Uncharacterized protein n=1 Tax=Puccinia triticina (isolate 1-1 / race 1 (BBBD)) TaxID=630390 RepID=A0A180G6Q9_PUCT1|nr:hypothetical protein PTTG_04500 [Puccinia triticina 1-1 BBBD Race 1]